MANATWKQVERRVAGVLGGERTGPTGRAGPDVVTSWCVAQVKHRRKLPAWLKTALDGICAQAGDWQLPIVVLHERGQRHEHDLVVLRLGDFVAWHGPVALPADEEGDDDGAW